MSGAASRCPARRRGVCESARRERGSLIHPGTPPSTPRELNPDNFFMRRRGCGRELGLGWCGSGRGAFRLSISPGWRSECARRALGRDSDSRNVVAHPHTPHHHPHVNVQSSLIHPTCARRRSRAHSRARSLTCHISPRVWGVRALPAIAFPKKSQKFPHPSPAVRRSRTPFFSDFFLIPITPLGAFQHFHSRRASSGWG